MKLISGLLTDPQTHDPNVSKKETVIRYKRGDVVKIFNHYAIITGFFRNNKGNRCMQLGFPADAIGLQNWAKKNPHHVKILESGQHLD